MSTDEEVSLLTRLRNPAFYVERTSDNFPLQTSWPEGITMPVFTTAEAALQWMDAYELSHDEYAVKGFYTLEDVRSFTLHYESGYQHIAIDPTPEPSVSPNIQPFLRLLEIAESEVE